MADIRPVTPPNLPLAPWQYERTWLDQFNTVLRLYFTTVSNAVNASLSTTVLELDDGITAPTETGGRAYIYIDAADGDLKIRFADGTVKTIITD